MGLDKAIGANGGAEKDATNKIKIPWSKWRETTGVMCDRNIPTQLIDNVYKTAIKPATAECGLLERRIGNSIHLKCACFGGQEDRQQWVK